MSSHTTAQSNHKLKLSRLTVKVLSGAPLNETPPKEDGVSNESCGPSDAQSMPPQNAPAPQPKRDGGKVW